MVDDFGRVVVTKRRSLHSNAVFLILGCREGGDSKMLSSNKSLPKSGFSAKWGKGESESQSREIYVQLVN